MRASALSVARGASSSCGSAFVLWTVPCCPNPAFSLRRRHVAHSVTTRRPPLKPSARGRRQSSGTVSQPVLPRRVGRDKAPACSCAAAEHVTVASHAANQFLLRPVRRVISLMETPDLTRPLMMLLLSCLLRKPSCWMRSAQVSTSGSITVDDKACRIDGIDRRTASRNAVLAFSVSANDRQADPPGAPPARCLSVATAPVPRDNGDVRVRRQPCRGGCRFSVR